MWVLWVHASSGCWAGSSSCLSASVAISSSPSPSLKLLAFCWACHHSFSNQYLSFHPIGTGIPFGPLLSLCLVYTSGSLATTSSRRLAPASYSENTLSLISTLKFIRRRSLPRRHSFSWLPFCPPSFSSLGAWCGASLGASPKERLAASCCVTG